MFFLIKIHTIFGSIKDNDWLKESLIAHSASAMNFTHSYTELTVIWATDCKWGKLNCQSHALTHICQNQSTKAATTVLKWLITKGWNPENQGSQTLGIHCICFSVGIQHATASCQPLIQQFNRTSKEAHQQREFFHLLSSFAGISSITHCFV